MPTMDKIRLDEEHRYWREVGGGEVRVPGFTEICKASGFPDNPHWTEEGKAEGIALHKWLLFLAQGGDFDSVYPPHESIAERVEGIRKFLKDHDFEFVGGETKLYHAGLGFCCTPDLHGFLDGTAAVVEMKGGARMKRHRLQTAAQALALAENGFNASRRIGLYLKDGDYTPEEHDDDEDFECWKAIVAGYFAVEAYK